MAFLQREKELLKNLKVRNLTSQIFQAMIENGWLNWFLIAVTVQQPLYFERCLVSRHQGTWWHYSYSMGMVSLGKTARWTAPKRGSGEEKALLYHTMSFCRLTVFWFRSHLTVLFLDKSYLLFVTIFTGSMDNSQMFPWQSSTASHGWR